MNRFAALLDRLAYEPGRNAKLRLLEDYFRTTPDPERGYALAAITGALSFANAKPALIRGLVEERVDPVLFRLSYDYVGDLSETAALIWPAPQGAAHPPAPPLSEIVETLGRLSKRDLPGTLARWLDGLDETGRWALLKLITGALRIGVSARLAKTAVARMGGRAADEVEEIWHGLAPPYEPLFAFVEGRADRPDSRDPTPFRAPMLAHPLEDKDLAALAADEFLAEYKWDGIRVQAAAGPHGPRRPLRLYSRTGDEISGAFPDLVEALLAMTPRAFALDGELLVMREGRVQPFASLQQRLNRKSVGAKTIDEFPAHIRAYDLLMLDGDDLRNETFAARRRRLETFVGALAAPRIDLSPLVRFATVDDLVAERRAPTIDDAAAVEGLMLKRGDSPYVPGRPKGLWWKWKRDPFNVDAVLMYAQRGHGKRSSFYSDYTFGCWKGDELVPVGKAYFGFTDEELGKLDKFVRDNTTNRFGPVREVAHGKDHGLVLEIAFEGLNRSARHKSGVAMRFPRVARIRWDKRPSDADRLDVLEAMLP